MEMLINLIVVIIFQCVHKHAIMLYTWNVQIYPSITCQESRGGENKRMLVDVSWAHRIPTV